MKYEITIIDRSNVAVEFETHELPVNLAVGTEVFLDDLLIRTPNGSDAIKECNMKGIDVYDSFTVIKYCILHDDDDFVHIIAFTKS